MQRQILNSRPLELSNKRKPKTETDKGRRGGEGGGQFVDANKDSVGKLLMQICVASDKTSKYGN